MLDLVMLADKIREAEHALQRETDAAHGHISEDDHAALLLCRRMLAIIRVVLDERKTKVPVRGWRVIVVALLVKVIVTIRAAQVLASAGHSREMSILIRSSLESLITAAFIAKKDSARRAKRWLQHSTVIRARFLRMNPDPWPEHKTGVRKILTRARRLEKLFPNLHFWASGLSKGSVRDLASDVDMLWYYDFVYWVGSQGTHASAFAVEGYLEESSHGAPRFRIGLSHEHLGRELRVCSALLFRAFEHLNRVCKLDVANLLRELAVEFKTAEAAVGPMSSDQTDVNVVPEA